MNIEIANRLVNLRKQNNLSQEALAEQLGISRQAVSKWERAEASPDTDNLILLARLYGVSLDELLQTEDEIITDKMMEDEEAEEKQNGPYNPYADMEKAHQGEYVHVGFDGIHVRDKDGSNVHVGWRGIHVEDPKPGNDNVDINSTGVFVNGERVDVNGHIIRHAEHARKHAIFSLPIDLLVIFGYIAYGISTNIWHPTWLVFFVIPLWHSLLEAILHRNANEFAYPVLATAGFLFLGLTRDMWHPAWVLFLTIPVYYGIVNYIKVLFFPKKNECENTGTF